VSVPTLKIGTSVISPTTGLRYTVARKLGQGGYGTAYLAKVTWRGQATEPSDVCLKVTTEIVGWVREAYFGLLFSGHPRSLSILDFFAIPKVGPGRFALVTEYAVHGDLVHYLQSLGRPWREEKIRREIIEVLRVLEVLHRGNALHRDLTPFNVFVFEGRRLKLGDFGIALHHQKPVGVRAGTFAPWLTPVEIRRGEVRHWQARDDIYQVGQLLGMLVKGSAEEPLTPRDIRSLECSDQLKEIIVRCVGLRRAKRFSNATELIRALGRHHQGFRESQISSFNELTVVFSGKLTITRSEAAELATRAGAKVRRNISKKTDAIVVGDSVPQMGAGNRGNKQIDVRRLREQGVQIRVIREAQFRRLVGL